MIRVRTQFQGPPGAPYLSTLFFGGDLAGADAANTAVGFFWGAIDNELAIGLSWATLGTVDEVDPVTGKTTAATVVTPQVGTGSVTPSNYAPQATQGLIQWRTNTFVNGREVRGRTFVPGIGATRVSASGKPVGSLTTAMANAAATLIAAAGSDLVVWSKRNGVAYSALVGTAWNDFAVLRSRRD